MLLTVNELQKTGLQKAGGREQRETRNNPTLLPINSSCTGATGALQQFQPTKNYFRLNSIARGLPSHFSSFKPKWLCDGLTANPNPSYSIACDNSFQTTAGDTVKAYDRTNHKWVSVKKPNRNQNCHIQRSTIHKFNKNCKIYMAPKARIHSIANC